MNIAGATENDLNSCEELSKIKEFEFPSGGTPTVDFFKRYIDPTFFLVARKNDEVVGFILGEELKNKVAMVWYLTVKDSFRGKGIGSNLVLEFEKRSKEKGIEWLILYAPTFTENSVNFYKKHGFNRGKSFYEMNKLLR